MAKQALVLSGSGMLYPAHLGAAQRLYEHGYKPDALIGTSGGAIVAAFLSSGKEPKVGLEYAKKILPKEIISFNWKMLSKNHWGLLSLNKLEKKLTPYVPDKFCNVKIPLYVVTTNVGGENTVVFSNDKTPLYSISKAVRASASVPFLFDPYYDSECNSLYTDGGVTNNMAVDLDVVVKSSQVIGIRLLSSGDTNPSLPKDLKEFVINVVGCMMREIERKHIEDASIFSKIINIKLSHNSMDFFNVSEKTIQELYDEGYKAVDEKFKTGWHWNNPVLEV
jgi:NTE family protein